MKLYVYDRNVKYNERLSNFITMSIDERNELFKKYKQSEKEVEVELFASGSTCLCYKVVGNDKSKAIYKQFCPLSFEEKGYIVRRDNAVYIHDEVEIDFIKEQYDNFLRQTFNNVISIGEMYNIEEINMFVRPGIVLTNLGYMFCAEITGETLEESYNGLLSGLSENKGAGTFLGESLYKTFRTLQAVKVAHANDTLILDLKSENLLNVTGDDKKEEITVRLIDFGSCINLDTMESIIEQEGAENFLDQYVYSNRKYYSQEDIKTVVKKIAIDKDGFRECAKKLDITAVKKIFCDILLCATNGFKTLDKNEEAIQTDSLEDILTNFFVKFAKEISSNLFEVYNIYEYIINFLKKDNIYDCMQVLVNILSILNHKTTGHVFWNYKLAEETEKVVNQQRMSVLRNSVLRDNSRLLKIISKNSRDMGFSDIISFAKNKKIKTVGRLFKYLWEKTYGIDYRLFPDILVDEKYYSNDNGVPIFSLVTNLLSSNTKKILLLGEASIGKTSALKYMQAKCIEGGTPCLYYQLKQLNHIDGLADFSEKLKNLPKKTILLLDGYDEILEYDNNDTERQDQVKKIFKNLDEHLLLISSRFSPFSKEEIRKMRSENKTICVATVQKISEENVKEILLKDKARFNKELMFLLRNTMFFSLYLKLGKNSKSHELLKINNETSFLDYYFEKYTQLKSEEIFYQKIDWEDEIKKIGKYIYDFRMGETLKKGTIKINSLFDNIFNIVSSKYEEWIDSEQEVYLNYAFAKYYASKLIEDNRLPEYNISDIDYGVIFRSYYRDSAIDAYYYTGQFLRKNEKSEKIIKALAKYAQELFDDKIFSTLLGFTDGVVDGKLISYSLLFNSVAINSLVLSDRQHLRLITKIYILAQERYRQESRIDLIKNCPRLKEVHVDKNHLFLSSKDGVLFGRKLSTLLCYPKMKKDSCYVIPDETEHLLMGAFSCNEFLSEIKISSGVTDINAYDKDCFSLFPLTNYLTSISVSKENQYYSSLAGVLFSKDFKSLIKYPIRNKNACYTVPTFVEKIERNAFNGASNIEKIILGENVKDIDQTTFGNCERLNNIEVYNNKNGFVSFNGVLYKHFVSSKGEKELGLVYYPQGAPFENYVVEKNTTIVDYEESGLEKAIISGKLNNLIIPSSIKRLNLNSWWLLSKIYYQGDKKSFKKATHNVDKKDFIPFNISFYAQTKPTNKGSYWRWVDGQPKEWE